MIRYKTFNELTEDERYQYYRACGYRYKICRLIEKYQKHKHKYRILLDELYNELHNAFLEIEKWNHQIVIE